MFGEEEENGRRPFGWGPLGGEDAGQADNQVRRTADMVDSQGRGYGVIAEGNVQDRLSGGE
ncbi:hypothetical protein [Mesorhizobium sp.]|uniref:hypothetical protein n=1 Tax=Mesorhizobium sp. TaxID=1871066 RepID=UPI000FEA60E3|nr:hypothetical protein [Mesorhizobium sp.]RWC56544.1 MAG: hypothetical protein EOS56_23935 [Mesorhizobium sp.]RWC60812.1 MAG: hypothetical protein EOS29_19480 [Mesorhizobium sp.]